MVDLELVATLQDVVVHLHVLEEELDFVLHVDEEAADKGRQMKLPGPAAHIGVANGQLNGGK